MKISIIGNGHVGKLMKSLFKEAIVYDEPLNIGKKEETLNSFAAFICVPTPEKVDGSCDTSIVEDVLKWIEAEIIIIRSTVPIGFTEWAKKEYGKNIVFQPEYYGETVDHPFTKGAVQEWLTFGGEQKDIDKAIAVYKEIVNSNTRIIQSPSKEIELAKYMENTFLAMKVTFCNEIFDIAEKMGLNYNLAREAWIADPRIGSSHTFVYEDKRGYSGKCLPKDMASLRKQAKDANADTTLLDSIVNKNNRYGN